MYSTVSSGVLLPPAAARFASYDILNGGVRLLDDLGFVADVGLSLEL
jgi:hypothetical protein